MSDVRFHVPRLARAWVLSLCLVTAAGVSAVSADGADGATGAMGLVVSGVETGATVSQPQLTLTIEPIGFGSAGPSVSGTGLDHVHVRVDGVLTGTYAERELIVDLSQLEPGWHTLTLLPADSDHVEVEPAAIALEIDYQPGSGSAASDPDTDAATEVRVALREWSLEPPELELPAGTYTFVVPNEGTIEHSLVISGEGVSASTPDATYGPGEIESFTVELVPGTYQMFCPLPWHKTTGMVGTIVVSG